ncbi:histidine kinase [Chitinophagaceae bacterium LB-8]|uniref:Histidine kinase n=1 Tax=Paraflavisolibacter caeni TaxID=2982496 RepID=A0A9X2XVY7_9BACT|nr:histidine kinase [Paraflavisolibacter caeni]MCU7549467.1 histidine kinase [Paraflavisolibacter caeni]
MHTAKIKINDLWFRFLGIPFIAFMSHVIFFNEQHGHEERFSFWEVYLIAVAEALLLWEANRLVIIWFRNKFPELRQSGKRISGLLAGCILVTIIVRYLNIWVYDQTLFWGYLFPPEGYLYNIFVGLLYVVIVAAIYEGIYYFQKWKQLVSETEALKRENLQTQLESLKAQINPHFLFNSLSSLASLIIEDQQKAVTFVNELSFVYRYLLQTNDRNLTTLSKELEFLNHYFHLLKTRFGNSIELTINVDLKYVSCMLPPLTLQLLVENAVKHNSILPDRPLNIHIYNDQAENLVVVNNLQKKSSMVSSDKLGLQNIVSKYKLLHVKNVVILQTEDAFQVVIPLIKNQLYESVDR